MGYNYAFESLVNSSSGKTIFTISFASVSLRALLIQVVVKPHGCTRHRNVSLRALLIQVVVKPRTITVAIVIV